MQLPDSQDAASPKKLPGGEAVLATQSTGQASEDIHSWQEMLTVSNVVLATLAAVGIGFLFVLFYQFYMVVFIFFIGISLSIAMKPAVVRLTRYAVPPRLSILSIYVLLGLAIALFLWGVVPLITTQIINISTQLPIYYNTFYSYLGQSKN